MDATIKPIASTRKLQYIISVSFYKTTEFTYQDSVSEVKAFQP